HPFPFPSPAHEKTERERPARHGRDFQNHDRGKTESTGTNQAAKGKHQGLFSEGLYGPADGTDHIEAAGGMEEKEGTGPREQPLTFSRLVFGVVVPAKLTPSA